MNTDICQHSRQSGILDSELFQKDLA